MYLESFCVGGCTEVKYFHQNSVKSNCGKAKSGNDKEEAKYSPNNRGNCVT